MTNAKFKPPETIYVKPALPTAHGSYLVCSFVKPSVKGWLTLSRRKGLKGLGRWLAFDLVNGDAAEPESKKTYVWVDGTKRYAEMRYKKHKRIKKLADLCKPYEFFLEIDL